MARKIPVSQDTRLNKRLTLENAVLSKKIQLAEKSLENSFSGLAEGLMGGGGFGGQAPITSLNPLYQNNQYQPITLLWTMLGYLYKSHGLIRAAIQIPVLDAIRGGLDLSSDQIDPDELRQVEDYLEEHGVLDRVVDTIIWARLYGGAALIINTEGDSAEPIGDELHDGELAFYDANRWELSCARRIPEDGKYGFYGKTLDASRVITVLGSRAPFLIRAQLSDWGFSEIEHMAEDFNLFLRGRNVIYEILDEAKLDVYSLKGFTAQLATPNGTALTTRRINVMNQLKNFNNALILDKEDTFDQKTLSFGGLAEILKENRIMIASALRMPMTKLFGIGSTGFSSGMEDLENYAAMVESEVRQPMKQILRKVLSLVVQHLFGEDLDIRFKFKPLRILSAVDEESIKTSKSNRFLALYDKLLINSTELGEMMQKEDLVPIPIQAAEGLLEDHPMPEVGQPVTAEMGAEPAAKAEKKADSKPEKAEKAEKPEKANSEAPIRRTRRNDK